MQHSWSRPLALGLAGLVAMVGPVSGCASSRGASSGKHPGDRLAGISASATQTRFDESTGSLRAGVTNNSHHPITVTRARVLWAGFTWPSESLTPEAVPPGQTTAFLVQPGPARCNTAPSAPKLTAVIDGVSVTLPLHIDLPGLLARLRKAACEQQALDKVARVSLRITRAKVQVHGTPYLLSYVDVRRIPGARARVTVVDVLGSVTFDLFPRSAKDLPATLPSEAVEQRTPVLVGPTRRCDAHARGQASQPFLFAIFTRVEGGAVHRVITVPDPEDQKRLLALVDELCGSSGANG